MDDTKNPVLNPIDPPTGGQAPPPADPIAPPSSPFPDMPPAPDAPPAAPFPQDTPSVPPIEIPQSDAPNPEEQPSETGPPSQGSGEASVLPPVIAPLGSSGPKAKLIASILGLVLLVVSIPTGIFLTQQRQDIRSQARSTASDAGDTDWNECQKNSTTPAGTARDEECRKKAQDAYNAAADKSAVPEADKKADIVTDAYRLEALKQIGGSDKLKPENIAAIQTKSNDLGEEAKKDSTITLANVDEAAKKAAEEAKKDYAQPAVACSPNNCSSAGTKPGTVFQCHPGQEKSEKDNIPGCYLECSPELTWDNVETHTKCVSCPELDEAWRSIRAPTDGQSLADQTCEIIKTYLAVYPGDKNIATKWVTAHECELKKGKLAPDGTCTGIPLAGTPDKCGVTEFKVYKFPYEDTDKVDETKFTFKAGDSVRFVARVPSDAKRVQIEVCEASRPCVPKTFLSTDPIAAPLRSTYKYYTDLTIHTDSVGSVSAKALCSLQ